MLTQIFLTIIVTFLNALFSFLPTISTLPLIGGYDIDTAMVNGSGMAQTFIQAVWPLYDVYLGALALFAYFGIKLLLKLFLGHRAPGTH